MSSNRPFFTSFIVLFVVVCVYLTRVDLPFSRNDMDAGTSIPIEVSLSTDVAEDSIFGSVKIHITLTNTSPKDLYILRWSSPLDSHVPAMGVVTFTSTKTGDVAPCLNMKVGHRMPASGFFSPDDQSIMYVRAHGKLDGVMEFKEPEVALVKGEEYSAKATGRWMGVWTAEAGQKVEKLLVNDDMRIGEFESNQVIVRVAGADGTELM